MDPPLRRRAVWASTAGQTNARARTRRGTQHGGTQTRMRVRDWVLVCCVDKEPDDVGAPVQLRIACDQTVVMATRENNYCKEEECKALI